MPEPRPLPPPLPAPPPPKPPVATPKLLIPERPQGPDIRIGKARKQTGARNRSTNRDSSGPKSLTIGNNQGLTI